MPHDPTFRDDHTYRSPWLLLLRMLAVRSAILFVVLAAGLSLSWPVVWVLCQPAVANLLGLMVWIGIAAVIGFVGAGLAVRNVYRDVELSRPVLLGSMLVSVTLAEYAAFAVAAAVHGVSPVAVLVPSVTLILWSWAAVLASVMAEG
jgi:hypothetical protein